MSNKESVPDKKEGADPAHDESIKSAQKYLEEHYIFVRDLWKKEPGRVSFTPMPAPTLTRTYHETGINHILGCYRVRSGAGLGAHAILATTDGHVLREQNSNMVVEESLIKIPNPCEDITPHLESAVSLVSASTYCFYHWMLDSLPKIIVAEACGFKGIYIVPARNVNSWIEETMGIFGIGPERYLHMNYSALTVDDLWIPTHFEGNRLHETPDLLLIFRRLFLQAAEELRPLNSSRIYVPRKLAHRERRIINADEVLETLLAYDFEQILMESFSIRQQIGFVQQARTLAGPHGSGILHSLFMPEGSLMIEFFAPTWQNNCMESIAKGLNHRYKSLLSSFEGDKYPHGGDIYVDIKALEKLLETELK